MADWAFVAAGYGVTALALAAYAWSLVARARRARTRAADVARARGA